MTEAVAAYHGRKLLGWIKPKGERFEAITADGENLGRFNSQKAAWSYLAERAQIAG